MCALVIIHLDRREAFSNGRPVFGMMIDVQRAGSRLGGSFGGHSWLSTGPVLGEYWLEMNEMAAVTTEQITFTVQSKFGEERVNQSKINVHFRIFK